MSLWLKKTTYRSKSKNMPPEIAETKTQGISTPIGVNKNINGISKIINDMKYSLCFARTKVFFDNGNMVGNINVGSFDESDFVNDVMIISKMWLLRNMINTS